MKKKLILISGGIVLLMATVILVVFYKGNTAPVLVEYKSPDPVKPMERLYGLPVDSFKIETGKVGRNQNLGQILQQFKLPERSLSQLLLHGGSTFDVRKMRVGNPYTVFLSKDSAARLQYLVYEHTPVDYVVFDFNDSVRVSLKQKEITTIQKRVEGEIKTSLWDAMKQDSINPQVALELSDIYQWTIDFFGLQPGDHFTVSYDEIFVNSVSIGLGQIHGVSFNHAGKELLAIPFMQDNTISYFDGEGNSLRRAFLKAPLRFSHISSRFSENRFHPILKIRRPHHGVDYAAPFGTPVYSIGDGRIVSASFEGGEGRMVKVRHNGVYTTTYMHLSGFAKGIQGGKYVMQGELLGYVGSSGLSTGPHLDFRVYKNGTPIDPLKMESPPVNPVKPENMEAFSSVKTETLQVLSGIDKNNLSELDKHKVLLKPAMILK